MFTKKKNNAKMAWDYGRDPVCVALTPKLYDHPTMVHPKNYCPFHKQTVPLPVKMIANLWMYCTDRPGVPESHDACDFHCLAKVLARRKIKCIVLELLHIKSKMAGVYAVHPQGAGNIMT